MLCGDDHGTGKVAYFRTPDKCRNSTKVGIGPEYFKRDTTFRRDSYFQTVHEESTTLINVFEWITIFNFTFEIHKFV